MDKELIWRLAKQAGGIWWDRPGPHFQEWQFPEAEDDADPGTLVKFVALIAEECARVADEERDRTNDILSLAYFDGRHSAGSDIRERFKP